MDLDMVQTEPAKQPGKAAVGGNSAMPAGQPLADTLAAAWQPGPG